MDQLLGMIEKLSLGKEDKPLSTEVLDESKKRRIKTKSNEAHKRRAVSKSTRISPMEDSFVVKLKSPSDEMKRDAPSTRKVTRARRTGTRTNARRVAPLPFQPLPVGASRQAEELYDEMQRMILPFRMVAPQLDTFNMAVQGRHDMLISKGRLSPKQMNILKVHRETYNNLKHIYEQSGVDLETLIRRIEAYLQFVERDRLRVDGDARLRMSQEYSRIFVHFPEVRHVVEHHKSYVLSKALFEPDAVRPGELQKADDLVELFGNFHV